MADFDSFSVRPADVTVHAAGLEACSDRVASAAVAGAAAVTGADAYGQLCAVVPILLDAVQGTFKSAAQEAAAALQDTASALRVTAIEYVAADVAAEGALRDAGGR